MPNVMHISLPLDIDEYEEPVSTPTDIEFILKHWRFSRLCLVSYYDDSEYAVLSEVLRMVKEAIPMLPLVCV